MRGRGVFVWNASYRNGRWCTAWSLRCWSAFRSLIASYAAHERQSPARMSTRDLRFYLRKSAPCSRQDGPRLVVAARSIQKGSRPIAMTWHARYFFIQRRLQSRVRRSGKAWKRPCSKTRRFKKDAFNVFINATVWCVVMGDKLKSAHGDFVRRNKKLETAFYLQKHHGTLRRAGGGRKVER